MKLLPQLMYALNKFRWYITRPLTLGVRLLLIRDHTILLVKHTYHKHWYLPGGGVKKGETLEAAIKREAKEELGAKLDRLRLFGMYSNFYEYKSDHVVVFLCEDFTLSGKTDREIEDFKFFDHNALPEDISPGSKRRVQEYKKKATTISSSWAGSNTYLNVNVVR